MHSWNQSGVQRRIEGQIDVAYPEVDWLRATMGQDVDGKGHLHEGYLGQGHRRRDHDPKSHHHWGRGMRLGGNLRLHWLYQKIRASGWRMNEERDRGKGKRWDHGRKRGHLLPLLLLVEADKGE